VVAWITSSNMKYVLFTAAIAMVVATYYFDLLDYLTLENAQTMKNYLGWWTLVVFVLAFIIGELLQVPSVTWIFLAGIVWPWWIAVPISLIGAMLAAIAAFMVARYFLGQGFHKKLPEGFAVLDRKLQDRPVSAVIVIRLTTFLHPIMHWVFAASSVRPGAFLAGTMIGILPLTIAIVLLGEVFISWWAQYSQVMLIAAGIATLAYVIHVLRKKQLSGAMSEKAMSEKR
jgi:uncharacterized membrane protein YdjX (TVP38/TMEM64 family)